MRRKRRGERENMPNVVLVELFSFKKMVLRFFGDAFFHWSRKVLNLSPRRILESLQTVGVSFEASWDGLVGSPGSRHLLFSQPLLSLARRVLD